MLRTATARRLPSALLLAAWALSGCEFAGGADPAREPIVPKRYNLVPLPRLVVERDGNLKLGADTRIATRGADPDLDRVATFLAQRLRSVTGYPVPVVSADAAGEPIVGAPLIELDVDPSRPDDEGYVLDVSTSAIQLSAKGARGVFYGVETLRQLLPGEVDAPGPTDGVTWSMPAVRIEDAPRFAYRGMHLDVSRHFFSVEFVERYIDLMALYKMNTFHWHLTDDQGWRIEIKKYPQLTAVGAMRKETVVGRPSKPPIFDGQPYGGFYTQDEIREVVAYAADRFVKVLPEIEMPGHCLAALASYPELACTPGPFETATSWGVFDDIYCPSEGTFQFLTDVLGEVITLFPDALVHVGGDEVPEARWRDSPVAQEVVTRESLASTSDLEAYFVGRIASFLTANGRGLVGWDEIAARGKVADATVMSWRGADTGLAAALQGYPVIMTPVGYTYFDQAQSGDLGEPLAAGAVLSLEHVYAFEPVPAGLGEAQAPLILGGQGNLWTEYVATNEHAEYMVFPRLLALSEALWSPRASRSYLDFLARLTGNAKHLDALGVNYAHHFESQ